MLTSIPHESVQKPMETEQPFERLLRSVNEGWRVQPPVYYRRQWYSGKGDKVGYYFILTRADDRDLIVVAESDQVRQFIELQRLKVLAA